jgi:AcrR family transcriptional regulator
VRQTAGERREAVLAAAAREFANKGLHGGSTDAIAKAAGISQPYLFRLFGTKKDLFTACYMRCCELIMQAFREAAEDVPDDATPEERLRAMGSAYTTLIANPDLLRIQMQGYVAAVADADIRATARRRFAELFGYVQRTSGVDDERVLNFFAHGMLLNVSVALGHSGVDPKEHEAWAASFRKGR